MALNFFNQYRGLRKELYIIFWGRVVTAMGALIGPMLTLILKSKLGYTASEVANLMLIIGLIQLPCVLIGGKLADKFNKKYIIVICDMVTVIGYLLCAFLPMQRFLIVIFSISGIFAQMESPSYDALIANMSTQEERSRAYSLNYMGANLGFILAPTLGGLLFENHLNLAFLFSSIATFSSTVLIFFFIKDTAPSNDDSEAGSYEQESKATLREIFSCTPVLMIFLVSIGITGSLYHMGNGFMMPLTLESVFSAKGALIFGTLCSFNGVVVIIGTPICTSLFSGIHDTGKLIMGEAMQMAGFWIFMLSGRNIFMYYISMAVFTIGEILNTLGSKPYITSRVPASHRGRASSVITVCSDLFKGVCLYFVGLLADKFSISYIWTGIILLGIINLLGLSFLRKKDKEQFPLLYR